MTIDINHSAFKTIAYAKFHQPNILEPLQEGIDYLRSFLVDPFLPAVCKDPCIEWVKQATALLGPPTVRTHQWPSMRDIEEAIVADAAAQLKHKNNGAIGPQICVKCKFKNDYAGPEHLSPDGSYTCRSCK